MVVQIHQYIGSDGYTYANAYTDICADRHPNAHMDTGRRNVYAYPNAYPHAYQDTDGDGYTDRNQDTHGDANGHNRSDHANGYTAALRANRGSRANVARCLHQSGCA